MTRWRESQSCRDRAGLEPLPAPAPEPAVAPTEVFAGDLALMQRVGDGDPQARRVLAHRLVGRIRLRCRLLLGSSVDCDDAIQNALVEILRAVGSYRGEASIESWADRIAFRAAIRVARSRRRWSFFFDPKIDPQALGSQAEAERSLSDGLPRSIEAYLATLPPDRRQAMVLKYAFGYTTEEIAELTCTAEGTVKDRLVMARRQIRRLIKRDAAIGCRKGNQRT